MRDDENKGYDPDNDPGFDGVYFVGLAPEQIEASGAIIAEFKRTHPIPQKVQDEIDRIYGELTGNTKDT